MGGLHNFFLTLLWLNIEATKSCAALCLCLDTITEFFYQKRWKADHRLLLSCPAHTLFSFLLVFFFSLSFFYGLVAFERPYVYDVCCQIIVTILLSLPIILTALPVSHVFLLSHPFPVSLSFFPLGRNGNR